MSAQDDMPDLAGLRRRVSTRRARPAAAAGTAAARLAAPTLFDLPEPEAQPALQPPPAATAALAAALPDPAIWSVSGLVRQVRGLVEQSFGQVWVEGEISNWRPAASGHVYFTLKDSESQLSIVIFRRQAALLRFAPKDGDSVRLRGQLSVYESRGQMQIVAERMEPVGLGALLAEVRALKDRLRQEGLFDRKRELPAYPRCIGIVTSVHGAALRDVVKVCRRRHAAVRLLVYPAAVQGPRCAEEVSAGVAWFSQHPERVDLVMVVRGGGSWEDLHGFDAERVARAIAACSVPVITGLGHATDSTIADAAADVAAPTPSAAAELVTAAQHRIGERVDRLQQRLGRAARYELLRARQRLSRLSAEQVLRRTSDELGRRAQHVDELTFRVESALQSQLRAASEGWRSLQARTLAHNPTHRIAAASLRLEGLRSRVVAAQQRAVSAGSERVARAELRLHALSPARVLERGYSLVYNSAGQLLTSPSAVELGETIVTQLARGQLRSTITARD